MPTIKVLAELSVERQEKKNADHKELEIYATKSYVYKTTRETYWNKANDYGFNKKFEIEATGSAHQEHIQAPNKSKKIVKNESEIEFTTDGIADAPDDLEKQIVEKALEASKSKPYNPNKDLQIVVPVAVMQNFDDDMDEKTNATQHKEELVNFNTALETAVTNATALLKVVIPALDQAKKHMKGTSKGGSIGTMPAGIQEAVTKNYISKDELPKEWRSKLTSTKKMTNIDLIKEIEKRKPEAKQAYIESIKEQIKSGDLVLETVGASDSKWTAFSAEKIRGTSITYGEYVKGDNGPILTTLTTQLDVLQKAPHNPNPKSSTAAEKAAEDKIKEEVFGITEDGIKPEAISNFLNNDMVNAGVLAAAASSTKAAATSSSTPPPPTIAAAAASSSTTATASTSKAAAIVSTAATATSGISLASTAPSLPVFTVNKIDDIKKFLQNNKTVKDFSEPESGKSTDYVVKFKDDQTARIKPDKTVDFPPGKEEFAVEAFKLIAPAGAQVNLTANTEKELVDLVKQAEKAGFTINDAKSKEKAEPLIKGGVDRDASVTAHRKMVAK